MSLIVRAGNSKLKSRMETSNSTILIHYEDMTLTGITNLILKALFEKDKYNYNQ